MALDKLGEGESRKIRDDNKTTRKPPMQSGMLIDNTGCFTVQQKILPIDKENTRFKIVFSITGFKS